MSIEKIVTVSWFDRLKQSAAGIGGGFALVAAMTGFLFWNEGRAVQTAQSLEEGSGIVVSVPAAQLDAANEGLLIHVTGAATAARPLLDPELGVTAPGLALTRKVEMYQWVERSTTEKQVNTGGSETQVTTYSYAKDWASHRQDPTKFHEPQGHDNPEMLISGDTLLAQDARLGAFKLDAGVIGQLASAAPWAVPADQADSVQAAVGAGMRSSLVDGAILLGRDPANPEVGDYRIRYSLTPLDSLSVIGRQAGEGIASYRTKSGDSLLMVTTGNHPASDMFAGAASANTMTSWAFRIAGLALMIGGFAAILAPLSVLVSVLPFLGSIMSFGTRAVAAVLGLTLGSLTIAAAWFFYRPLTSAIILGIAAALIAAVVLLSRRRKAAKAGAVAA